jgi:hypothetical protein
MMNKSNFLLSLSLPILLSSFAQAELSALAENEMEAVSGKGIRIDANVDFAQTSKYEYSGVDNWVTTARDDTWVNYAKILVDDEGRVLSDATSGVGSNDGYINYHPDSGKTGNVTRETLLNGYNVVYKDEADGDYLIRKPHYLLIGEITGGIRFSGLELELVGDFGEGNNRAAMKWTLPEEIVFDQFEIAGLYVSEDQFISRDDNKLFGIRLDGPIYLPSTPDAYVFVTSD